MKFANLSLVAIVVAGLASSSFAADTLADAFKNGSVSGELRAWYFDREGSAINNTAATRKVNSDIFNAGVDLSYVTSSFYGFKAGATFQSSYAPFADGSLSQAGTAKSDFKGDEYGSGAVLSEAYLEYTLGHTTAKVGRQYIKTPLINGSPARIIKQSFEGATVVNTDLPATTLLAGVVTKYQNRTDGQGNVATFNALTTNDDFAYTLAAINKSLPGTTLTAQWVTLNNFADFYYAEAAYEGKAGNFSYGAAANYEYKDPDIVNAKSGTMYGGKLSAGYGDFNSYVAYTRITDNGDVSGLDGSGCGGFGGAAQPAFAKGNSSKTGTYERDSKAYSVDANYNFKQVGVLAGARYTGVTVDSSKIKDRGYTDYYVSYAFAGALKGLALDVTYQDWSKDVDGHDFFFKANYKF